MTTARWPRGGRQRYEAAVDGAQAARELIRHVRAELKQARGEPAASSHASQLRLATVGEGLADAEAALIQLLHDVQALQGLVKPESDQLS